VFEPASDRPGPIELLERQAEARVSEFGADPLWADAGLVVHVLSRSDEDHGQRSQVTPRSGLTVKCCGDAHLSNFGVFALSDRRFVFEINDSTRH